MRERDALERVVVVVEDDDVPRPAEAGALAAVEPLARRSECRAHAAGRPFTVQR